MERASERLAALDWGGAVGAWALGIAVALGMLLVTRWLLPRDEAGKVRTPAVLLLAHLVLSVATLFVDEALFVHRVLQSLALLLLLVGVARLAFVLVVDAIARRHRPQTIPKIFRDILEGLVYGAAVLVTLRQAGAQLDALLTTSALLTAVVGLSLQDTLGNLFAGLSIQAQNPFEVGDWIQYGDDETTMGRVIEINWRAIRVITLDAVEVTIPNGPLARTPLRNFTKPTPVSRRSLAVVLPFSVPPERAHQVLVDGVTGIEGVLSQPAPSVLTRSFTPQGVQYWVRYFIVEYERREQIDGTARNRIWYALHRAGIPFAIPVGELGLRQDDERAQERARTEAAGRRRRALGKVDFLRSLSAEQLDTLAEFSREQMYTRDEIIIREGESGEDFFIVLRGAVAVLLGRIGELTEVARLGAGSFFGEMSVMTGQPRTATIRSVEPTELLVVGKEAMQRVLEESPDVAEKISEALAARREQLDSAVSAPARAMVHKQGQERRELLERIKEFFSLSL